MQRLLTACALTALLSSQAHAQRDIVDTAVAAGSFKTLATALKAADLVKALKGKGPFTVFAPTDDAFGKLPEGAVATLLEKENRDQLAGILTFHVASGRFDAGAVGRRGNIDTLNGQRLDIQFENGRLRVNGATVLQSVQASNGIIHVIDSVMLPEGKSLPAVAAETGRFRTLLAAVRAAGLLEALQGEGPFTVFAPTDAAFGKLPRGTVESLLEPKNRETLARILKFHVVPARAFADQVAVGAMPETLAGEKLNIRLEGGRLRVQDANVIAVDYEASNGVAHIIDSVMLPPEKKAQPRGRKYFGFRHESPGAALAAQLDLDRHKSFVITEVIKGTRAQEDGLQKYDVVLKINDRAATDGAIDQAKSDTDYGDTVSFEVIRGGKRTHLRIRVGEDKH